MRRARWSTRIVKGVLVALLIAFTLFPVLWMVSSAFDAQAGRGIQTLLPREWTLENL